MSNDSIELADDPKPPDQVQLTLLAVSFVLAIALGIQKWFLAPRAAHLAEDFGVEMSALTRLVVLSPRLLAIPLFGAGAVVAVLGLMSRKTGVLVLAALTALNIAMLFLIETVKFKLFEDLS